MKKLLLFLITTTNFTFSQQSTLSSGNSINNLGGNISYSVGQIDYINNNNGVNSFSEGVQQPYEISEILDTKEFSLISEISIFPNPTFDLLNIEIKNLNQDLLRFEIIDNNGKIVFEEDNIRNSSTINFQKFQCGFYYLKIKSNNKTVKSFKIIKK